MERNSFRSEDRNNEAKQGESPSAPRNEMYGGVLGRGPALNALVNSLASHQEQASQPAAGSINPAGAFSQEQLLSLIAMNQQYQLPTNVLSLLSNNQDLLQSQLYQGLGSSSSSFGFHQQLPPQQLLNLNTLHAIQHQRNVQALLYGNPLLVGQLPGGLQQQGLGPMQVAAGNPVLGGPANGSTMQAPRPAASLPRNHEDQTSNADRKRQAYNTNPLSPKRAKRKPSENSFPFKLFHILSKAKEDGYDDIVDFTDDGKAICIHDVEKFEKEVSPKHFRHEKFASFQRQLYIYCFQKLQGPADKCIFAHPNFQRGRKDLISQIERQTQTEKYSFQGMDPNEAQMAALSGYVENKAPFFPQKLYRLLLDLEVHGQLGIARFEENGFSIQNRKAFAEWLAKYFKHNRMQSFRRQLNLYGFTRDDEGVYRNPLFVKGRPELLRQIRRPKTGDEDSG